MKLFIFALLVMSFGAHAVPTDCPAMNHSERGVSAKKGMEQVKAQGSGDKVKGVSQ